jgi:hypothetical protein
VERTKSLIEVAQRFGKDSTAAYAGIDWFDARPAHEPRLSVKQAHAALHATGAQVRLIPGDPASSLGRVANAHPNTQLLLIANSVSDDDLVNAWFYVPRMLRADSLVLRESRDAAGQPEWTRLSMADLATRAERAAVRRVA